MPNEKVFPDAFGGLTEPHQKSPYMVRDRWAQFGQLFLTIDLTLLTDRV